MNDLPEDIFRRLCEQASVGIIITDSGFRILTINASAAKFFDVNAEDVMGQSIELIIPKHHRNITRKLFARSVSLSRPLEYRIRRSSSGIKRYLSIMVDPIRADQKVDGVCFQIRDLTRRMDLEKRLSQIEKLASLGQLAGGLAHHFNNIFGGIVTAIDHALKSDDPSTSRRTLQLVSQGIDKAVDLTRKLLEFSTPQTTEQNLADLTEAAISFTEQVEPKLVLKGRQIELEIKSAPILAVHPGKMRQIFQALLNNSEQAMGPSGGKIKIIIESDENEVKLFFCDTGPGISYELADRIFEPFFTTRGALGGGGEGNLGLGLTIANRLTKDIGGTLTYSPRSDSEIGSCFLIGFPLYHNDKQE